MFVTFNRHYLVHGFELYHKHGNDSIIEQEYKSTSEARDAAIEQLNYLINEQ